MYVNTCFYVIVKVNLNFVLHMLDCAACCLNKVIISAHAAGTGVAHPVGKL